MNLIKRVKPPGKVIYRYLLNNYNFLFHQEYPLVINLHRKKIRMALRIYDPFTNKFYSYIKIY